MDYGIISCIPITVLIVGVLITKRMAEMMMLASITGAILVYKAGFFSGWIDMMYGAVSDGSFEFLLFLLLGFGVLIRLFEQSGAFLGFANLVSKFVKGRKSAMVVTWIMGILMFVDDYLNVLAVSTSMKSLTDEYRIPREHLAYGVNSMGACVCVLVPIASWAAFAMACASDYGLGMGDYVRALPFMFFPIIAVVVCLLVALGIIPKVGLLKKAYERVDNGGPLLLEEKVGASIVNLESDNSDDIKPGNVLFFIIPIIVLVAGIFICDGDVISGIYAAIVSQAVIYVGSRRMNLTEFMDNLIAGITSMSGLAFVILNAFMLGIANDTMGFSEYVINAMTGLISPQLLPMLTFLIVGLVTFAASSYFPMIMLSIPIFIPLAIKMGIDPAIAIAAIMSGAAFGSKFCFYSDAVFMTSAGTGVNNMTQIKVVAPYVLSSVALAAIAYLIVGFIVV